MVSGSATIGKLLGKLVHLRVRCANQASVAKCRGEEQLKFWPNRREQLAKRNATVAVIGAGDFIGAAIAKKFATEGFAIFAGRRNADKLQPLVADVEKSGVFTVGRCQNNFHIGPKALQFHKDFSARHSGKGHIQQNDINPRLVSLKQIHRGFSIAGRNYSKTSLPQHFCDCKTERLH